MMTSISKNPNLESIKCVVIGDNNVGKTRLVFSRANARYDPLLGFRYSRYGGPHIPTVWAIDHYRTNAEILKKARDYVDGVDVSLRLWDTFGDHQKDRRFSYGNADVILMCFSICHKTSFQNIVKFWLPEVQKRCKFIPILLVGCKVDLRFADFDELNKRKNPLAKTIRRSDILFPEECRRIANEIGCPYYETSVFSGYGVKELFENAVRAALTHRRKIYLYRKCASLKHVRKPLFVRPLSPPRPKAPDVPTVVEEPQITFSGLYNCDTLADIIIVCQNTKFYAHKAILASSSNVFHRLFSLERSENDRSVAQNEVYVVEVKGLCEQTESLNVDSLPNLLSAESDSSLETSPEVTLSEYKTYSQFEFVHSYVRSSATTENMQDVLYLESNISSFSFSNIMKFCYDGHLSSEISSSNWLKKNIKSFSELYLTSQQFGVHGLPDILTKLLNESDSSCHDQEILKKFIAPRKSSIREILLCKETYADVVFKVDDGSVPGHKPFLVCGCDMMHAMFGGTFVESENKEIVLPGTTVRSLESVFEYIYTGVVPVLSSDDLDYNDVIALADRLCLPNLISLLERQIIEEFTNMSLSFHHRNLYEQAVVALQYAQLHNAVSLCEWCIYYLSTNYNDVCKNCKLVKELSHANQKILEERRWPPVWYIKDLDNYEKACKQREMEKDGKNKNKILKA